MQARKEDCQWRTLWVETCWRLRTFLWSKAPLLTKVCALQPHDLPHSASSRFRLSDCPRAQRSTRTLLQERSLRPHWDSLQSSRAMSGIQINSQRWPTKDYKYLMVMRRHHPYRECVQWARSVIDKSRERWRIQLGVLWHNHFVSSVHVVPSKSVDLRLVLRSYDRNCQRSDEEGDERCTKANQHVGIDALIACTFVENARHDVHYLGWPIIIEVWWEGGRKGSLFFHDHLSTILTWSCVYASWTDSNDIGCQIKLKEGSNINLLMPLKFRVIVVQCRAESGNQRSWDWFTVCLVLLRWDARSTLGAWSSSPLLNIG